MANVRIGLIGAGNIANTHMENYKNVKDAQVVAICDIDKGKAERLAAKFGVEKAYGSIEEMIAGEKSEDCRCHRCRSGKWRFLLSAGR
jgi:predicted dehydrogenase